MEDPLWMQGTAGVPAYSAKEDRGLVAALFDEGVEDWTALKVSQRALGLNMSVDVAAGRCVVTGDDQADQGNYICRETSTPTNLAIATQATNSRIDIIVLQVNDPNAGGSAGNNAVIKVVQGVASGTPTAPATPNSALLLATVGPITSATATITDAMITDNRVLWGERISNPGTMKDMAGTHVPNGWLKCDGSEVSRTGQARLFAEIGTSYGPGNGTTTFNLPDLRGKFAVPMKTGQAQVDTIGETGGAYTKTLIEANLPPHAHSLSAHTHTMAHSHSIDPPATYVTTESSGATFGGPYGQVDSSITNPVNAFTFAGSNKMQVDIAPFTSGGSSAANTGGPSTTNTGNGSGTSTPVDILPPYQVIGMTIIRT